MMKHQFVTTAIFAGLLVVGTPYAQVHAQVGPDYGKAVKDAEVAEPQEITTQLVAIVPSNHQLVWRGAPDHLQVKVVTWTNWNGYDNLPGKPYTTTRETWVTAVPQVKFICNQFPKQPEALTLRLEQFMGLPANNGKTKFVEMWVKPADLFRPCPDPEITDHECEVDFPNSALVSINQSHVDWFNKLKSQSYTGTPGYPWTRLGYTYDWGNPYSVVGASEFVVKPGATVDIDSVTPTSGYCQAF
jgi:hypothetical protein